jgi:hypothetical protein
MHQLERQHPGVAEVKNIGKSSEGRDLLVLKLGRKSQLNKPAMWIDAGKQTNHPALAISSLCAASSKYKWVCLYKCLIKNNYNLQSGVRK